VIFFLIFFLSNVSFSKTFEINKDDLKYIIEENTYSYFDEITPFCLGAVNNPETILNFGTLLGKNLLSQGIRGTVIGMPLTLTNGEYNENLFGNSPYFVAETLKNLSYGLLNSGVLPILDLRYGYDEIVMKSLINRKLFLPMLIDEYTSSDLVDEIKKYDLPVLSTEGKIVYLPSDLRFPDWNKEYENIPMDEIVMQILIQSTVIIKRMKTHDSYSIINEGYNMNVDNKAVIVLNNPMLVNVKYYDCILLVHSLNDEVLENAEKIIKGISSSGGRKNW